MILKVQEGAGRSLCAVLTCCLSLPQLLNPPTKMSCQQNQQQCQPPPKCVPKCPTPKCPPKCPPVSSCCDVSSEGCCGSSSGGCCSSGCGGCCLSHHRRRRSHHCRPHRSDCCSQPSGGSGCCGGGSGQSYGGGCCWRCPWVYKIQPGDSTLLRTSSLSSFIGCWAWEVL